MGTAVELPTPQVPGTVTVIHRAYRLSPPVSYETYEEDVRVTATVEYVVVSHNLIISEVMAFPGVYTRNVLSRRERVDIADLSEVAVIKNERWRLHALLEQMGYETITDLNGITTVRTPERGVENHGRWGQGGPGSDDYMSFGAGE